MLEILNFKVSKPFTLGVELEIFLADGDTFYPSNSSKVIQESIPERLKPFVQKELLQFMIEVITPVCSTPEEVGEKLRVSDCSEKLYNLWSSHTCRFY